MKAIVLEKAYNPKNFEDRIYARWKAEDAFKPKPGTGKPPYVVVIPPPNVTGVLHLGHGLNISLQDIIVRFHRMRGESALWVPGTDHAGIATQHVVEKRLKAQGVSRLDLGREGFAAETWKVKEEHHKIISRQIARMGASVDWSRERFTLDPGLSAAVREVFVSLYERDLLYKGSYLVNWCASCGTALSDDEVEREEEGGFLYHIKYPLGAGFLEIATTRPETLLGDTALAVHPEDPRYTSFIGQEALLPLVGRRLPVVADTYVDRAFGTGVVKITPAHDPNDWELAKRHNLPVINILGQNGALNSEVPAAYQGMGVAAAREAVVRDLKEAGLFVKQAPLTHTIGRCYRCNTVIEPYLSEQWFVRMKPLAEKALAAWRKGEVAFYPRKWEHTYQYWLEHIRDWCISRQLWWGHRIPAWTCPECGALAVAREDPPACPRCGASGLEQDPDVLDTWFSSWLWPFSTLGWPEKTSDFAAYYPTTALVTGYDIIFFWVARMIMAGLEFTGRAPFKDVYLTGLLRDKQGRKMSKTAGNGLDPLELVDEVGSDALKFTMAFLCAQGQDILMDKGSFKLGSKFANKLWNAGRYILMNLEGREPVKDPTLSQVDRWIYSRLNTAAKAMTEAFLSYRYNDAASKGYEYFWNDFCDWYVEAAKASLKTGADQEKDRAAAVLLDVLGLSLRLLHPLLPFITEELYGKLPENTGRLLMTSAYPVYDEKREDPAIEELFGFLQEIVRLIRTLRSECAIPPDLGLRVRVRLDSAGGRAAFLQENAGLVKRLAGVRDLELREQDRSAAPAAPPQGSIGLAGSAFELFVYIAEAVDMEALARKFAKEAVKERAFTGLLEKKLSDPGFLKNAPPLLVQEEGAKLADARRRVGKLESYLGDMRRLSEDHA
ncbi:MAG: valine--tRNA ligase [Spirochaetaceae bacterium]|jgi:valyl-tRNA synthetase|nr:valine--tRNA ligase [Spirochaetaceae bacterium]